MTWIQNGKKTLTALTIVVIFQSCGASGGGGDGGSPGKTPSPSGPSDQAPSANSGERSTLPGGQSAEMSSILGHIQKKSNAPLTGLTGAELNNRFYVHKVIRDGKNILGEQMPEDRSVASTNLIAFADVDNDDNGATYHEAQEACLNLSINGLYGWHAPMDTGAWGFPAASKGSNARDIMAYLDRSKSSAGPSLWSNSPKFWTSSYRISSDKAFGVIGDIPPQSTNLYGCYDESCQKAMVICIQDDDEKTSREMILIQNHIAKNSQIPIKGLTGDQLNSRFYLHQVVDGTKTLMGDSMPSGYNVGRISQIAFADISDDHSGVFRDGVIHEDAGKLCDDLTTGEFTDWRLPKSVSDKVIEKGVTGSSAEDIAKYLYRESKGFFSNWNSGRLEDPGFWTASTAAPDMYNPKGQAWIIRPAVSGPGQINGQLTPRNLNQSLLCIRP